MFKGQARFADEHSGVLRTNGSSLGSQAAFASMLTWSSIGFELETAVLQHGRKLRLAICPFIQLHALKRLLAPLESLEDTQVITRWNAPDIISGVSDIEVFPYLRDLGVPLFVHRRIHLKLYIFDDGSAFLGSGNLTQSGLGWGDHANVEAGSFVALAGGDWAHISKLLRESSRVDEAVYSAAAKFKERYAMPRVPPLPEFEVPSSRVDGFSLLELPAAASPDALVQAIGSTRNGGPAAPELMHDIDLLGLNLTTCELDPTPEVLNKYRQLPPVQAVVGWLSESGGRSFGEVTQWLHSRLIDRPVPYRTDVKAAVANLYRWLPLAFNTISVSRPHHSEVLQYKKPG